MRKWIALLLFLLIAAAGAFYVLTPNQTSFRQKEQFFFSAKAVSRALFNEATWKQWWPGEEQSATTFRYQSNTYSIREKKFSSLLIDICHEKDTLATELVLIGLNADRIELEWVGTGNPSGNLFSRAQKSRWVKGVASDVATLLQKIKTFYTQADNLYPVKIREAKVMDSTLISTSATVSHYPDGELIYDLLDTLKTYAELKGARQTGFPMLNVTEDPDGKYLARVALPIDKKLPGTKNIQYRWMLGGGNILVTEVKGGPHKINQAFTVLEQYVDDFNRVAPAIPFQSLVTDRRAEPDTAKWVTKVYWPVM